MNIRRFFLNIGLLLLCVCVFMPAENMYHNSFVGLTKGTIREIYPCEAAAYVNDNGEQVHYKEAKTEYTVDGVTYYQKNVFKQEENISVGDTVTVCYEKDSPEINGSYYNYFPELIVLICAAVLIILCRAAFKDYRNGFIKKYPKAFLLSVISIPVLCCCYILTNTFIGPFPPLGMLTDLITECMPSDKGISFFLLIAPVVVFLANITVWIAAVRANHRNAVTGTLQ